MNVSGIREQLHRQIDALPEELVRQIAEYTLFVVARRKVELDIADWDEEQWQEFSLEQFLRDGDDEVAYSLEDAKEVFHS